MKSEQCPAPSCGGAAEVSTRVIEACIGSSIYPFDLDFLALVLAAVEGRGRGRGRLVLRVRYPSKHQMEDQLGDKKTTGRITRPVPSARGVQVVSTGNFQAEQ